MNGAGWLASQAYFTVMGGQVGWQAARSTGRRLRCLDDKLVLARRTGDGTLVPLFDTKLVPETREVPFGAVAPGELLRIGVEFRAPAYPCTTMSLWKMVDASGALCFPEHTGIWCKVQVVAI